MADFRILTQTTVTRSHLITADSEEEAQEMAKNYAAYDDEAGTFEDTQPFVYDTEPL